MTEQLKNLAESKLDTGIDDTVTSLAVTATEGSKFPSTGNFRITLEDEIMLCTSRSTDTLTVTRGQEGSANVAHSAGVDVVHTLTKAGLDNYLIEQAQAGWMIALG